MGGFGAAHLGFKYPEVFGVVSIQAPPLLGPDLTQPLPRRAWSKLFATAMGGDLEYFRENDPFALAAKNADALRDRSFIRIICHIENENWLAPQCEKLHKVLMDHTIPHQFLYLSNVKSHNRRPGRGDARRCRLDVLRFVVLATAEQPGGGGTVADACDVRSGLGEQRLLEFDVHQCLTIECFLFARSEQQQKQDVLLCLLG